MKFGFLIDHRVSSSLPQNGLYVSRQMLGH